MLLSCLSEGMNEEPSGVGEILQLRVERRDVGMRLDRYVALLVNALSRSHVRHLIDAGYIQINQCDVKPSRPVQEGDRITVRLPLPQPSDIVPEMLPLEIVYEDADVIVVNKAAGMVTHPAPGHHSGTLVNALLARYPDMHIGDDLRPGIVHRLDQGTSGLLVVARHNRAMHMLAEQQRARTMYKAYLVVVEGRLKEWEGVIDAPIGRHPVDRKRQAIVANGREARTCYRVLEELGNYTLLEAVLETGRTHQIRVHFAHKGHFILGDPLYSPRKPKVTFGLTRQFLHAYKLGFVLPTDNIWHEYTVPLPVDLEVVLEKLRVINRVR